ncbi:MAG TPA: response regulator [Bacillota bacterium]|nr:response regulator [Bacillota bacterium]HOL08864.1 response regulator [Bacillota bacterium]HPO96557.1 response regulator [Bacillota bacterium]
MWRAILVDDEEYVRTELASLFPWQQYRFELIGEAENARTAIELIEKTQPDLVITDIRMPEMDGLELISWIKQHHPEIMAAVVSAYNDFPSVREALRLGAVDYFIKAEATAETAGTFLSRIDAMLERYYSVLFEQEETTSNLAKYHQLAVKSFWRDVLTRASNDAAIKQRAAELEIDIENIWFGLIFVHITNYQTFPADVQQQLRQNLETQLQAQWHGNWNIVDFKKNDFIIICSLNQRAELEMVKKLHNLARKLADDFPGKITVSASGKFSSVAELPCCFREVQEINLLRLYHHETKYFETVQLLKLQNKLEHQHISELLHTWEKLLRNAVSDELSRFIDNIFQNIMPENMSPHEARQLLLDLITILRRVSYEYQIHSQSGADSNHLEPNLIEILDEAESLSDWKRLLEKTVVQFINSVKQYTLPQSSATIRKALVYIQANFTRNLSLEEVAEHVGVSKSYLCRIFPEHIGEHFSTYLQRLRIERAKELLRFTNDHIYEIASKVGFWNSRYFSKVFHELVGMTPADYRRILPANR